MPAAPAPSHAAPARPPAPEIDGKPLYERYCALCHGKDAKGYAADNAPSLVSQTFLESASGFFIAQAIRVGRPGTSMAGYVKRRGGPLEEPEISAIVKYLRSLGPAQKRLPLVVAKGDPDKGAKLYQQQCTKCHGTKELPGKAPMLLNPDFLAASTATFLNYAIVNGRPPTQMPAFKGTLTDSQIDDLVMYLYSQRPGYRPPMPPVDMDALAKLPVVTNPNGKTPKFTLREDRFVSIAQVKKALDAHERLVIIDARAASDFVLGHIPGAISNPYYDRASLSRVPKDGTWVVAYCACPHHASGEVVDELRRQNYPHTAVLDEGILEWQRHDYPMAEGVGSSPLKQKPPTAQPKKAQPPKAQPKKAR
jgi:mono/diheme cytochrome c family protein/rhodanese-related sulfurtransferase